MVPPDEAHRAWRALAGVAALAGRARLGRARVACAGRRASGVRRRRGAAGDEAVGPRSQFPESSFDFRACFDFLRVERRVVAFDFLGFGLSDKPAAPSYSLVEQADLIEVVLREIGVRWAHVVAPREQLRQHARPHVVRELGLSSFELRSVSFTNGSRMVES